MEYSWRTKFSEKVTKYGAMMISLNIYTIQDLEGLEMEDISSKYKCDSSPITESTASNKPRLLSRLLGCDPDIGQCTCM